MKDKRTPPAAKVLLWLAFVYMFLPFDIVPDFIPVLGQIDDIIIVPILFYFAMKMIPSGIVEEYRSSVNQ